MPKIAGRRVFYAALAVPIAMVIAPLTASAGEAGETVVTGQEQPVAVAAANEAGFGGFSPGPDWYVADDADVVHSESEDTQVTYVVNGIYNDSVVGNASEQTTVVENEDDGFSPGPHWYESDDADIVHSESEDTQVTYVVNGIHNNTVIGNSNEDNTYVGDGVHEHDVVHDDEDGHEHDDADIEVDVDNSYDDTTWTYFEELSASAGHGGAYVDSVESGSFHQD